MFHNYRLAFLSIVSIIVIQLVVYLSVIRSRTTLIPASRPSDDVRSSPSPSPHEVTASLPICVQSTAPSNANESSSIYRVNVSRVVRSFAELTKRHGSDLQLGGHGFSSDCRSAELLALIVCYREREQHLKLFLDHLHPFLKRQRLNYMIFVVNQHGREEFNRGALFNVGFLQAIRLQPFTCFIFHDVDLLPEDSRNLYQCTSAPRHM